jgi:hypothetical protein
VMRIKGQGGEKEEEEQRYRWCCSWKRRSDATWAQCQWPSGLFSVVEGYIIP